MPINKNALLRYQVLDECFRNSGREYWINDLIDECERVLEEHYGYEEDPKTGKLKHKITISRRQILKDIDFMESEAGYKMDIQRKIKNRRAYFYYEDRTQSINNKKMTQEEANQIRDLIFTFNRFKNIEGYEWLNTTAAQLTEEFKLEKGNEGGIAFQSNPSLKGEKYISVLHRAIQHHKPLKVEYKTFSGGKLYSLQLSPYFLKQYNNRWFLFAQSDKYQSLTNIALDTIENIEGLSSDLFIPNTSYNFDTYFDEILGVTIPDDKKIEEIVLNISSDRWRYIKNKPFHSSQEVITEDPDTGTAQIKLKLMINHELITKIFEQAHGLEVVRPIRLRDSIIERAEKMLGLNK